MRSVEELRDIASQWNGARDVQRVECASLTAMVEQLKQDIIDTQEAQQIAQFVATETQQSIIEHVTDIVSLALEAVFGGAAYKFGIEFVERRGKSEADIFFIRDSHRVDPMDAAGGGAVDVAAMALRVALWSIARSAGKAISETIILDEPFRFLSVDLQPRAGEMLRVMSSKLGVQFIIVTHIPALSAGADKVYRTKNVNGFASVTAIDNSEMRESEYYE